MASIFCGFLSLSPVFAQQEDMGKKAFELAQTGEYAEALKFYETAISENDKNANFFYYKGVCHFELHQYTEAVSAFTRAIDLHGRRADYFSNRGKAFLRLSDFGQAAEDFSRAIKLDPLQGEFYYLRATARYGSKNYEASLNDYHTAINTDDRVGEYYLGRGECYLALGDRDRACQDIKMAVERHAFNARFQFESLCESKP
ncbi:MAG: tetratricopeptide repeat protein [Bacteroidia bacterium]